MASMLKLGVNKVSHSMELKVQSFITLHCTNIERRLLMWSQRYTSALASSTKLCVTVHSGVEVAL